MNDMNDTINFCVKRLINEVQCRPAIWDSRIKEYSDRALKREAWDELCASFVPHFHEASPAEKNGIVALLQKKWKSVRDAFLRELKRSIGKSSIHTRYAKPYAYYDNLIFLKPVCEVKARREDEDMTFSNETVTIEFDENDDSDTYDNSSVIHNENKADSVEPDRKKRRTQDTEETVINMLADHIKYKRKRDAHEDPDRQFLLSLLPDLKSMDPKVKFDLKYEIMNVIKRYRDDNFKFNAASFQQK